MSDIEKGTIQADPRHLIRSMKFATQGSVIKALVELITNSDDSYTRLEEGNKNVEGVIEVEYKKDGHCGIFAVRDYAEGMSIDDVRINFRKYGAETSGLKQGKKVRGYFGQGAKDALVVMDEGKICTFKDGKFVECKLFIENNEPKYEIKGPIIADIKLREKHKINGNGTVAYFKTNPKKNIRTPQINTIHEELANNYLLRKIMANPNRLVRLVYGNLNETRILRYKSPEGKEVLSEKFIIEYENENKFQEKYQIKISVFRADTELNQKGDSRQGGLLITDEEGIVLDISLFKYENEPLASHIFGEVTVGNFRNLLSSEEAVLTDERNGLARDHKFCKLLIDEIEKRLDKVIKAEKQRRIVEEQGKIDSEEALRFRKAFDILNEIAEEETQEVINLGGKSCEEIEEPPNGMCIYPTYAQITVSKRYSFELRIIKNIIKPNTVIKISCNNPKIKIITDEISIQQGENDYIIKKYITLEGREPNIEGTISACYKNITADAKVYVVPEKEMLLSEGMVFQPESITLRPNQPKQVYLLVYSKIIYTGSKIMVKPENDAIHVFPQEIIVNVADAEKNIAKYKLQIYGEGIISEQTFIKAEYENFLALLGVSIKIKEDKEQDGKKGMFRDPEFNFEPEPLQRSHYSFETGKILIYVNFPSIKHYLGENCQLRKTLPAQVLVADLVAERCFYEIAKKKVDSSAVLIRPEARSDNIQREALILSRKYGKKIHEMLVDQSLLREYKKQ